MFPCDNYTHVTLGNIMENEISDFMEKADKEDGCHMKVTELVNANSANGTAYVVVGVH